MARAWEALLGGAARPLSGFLSGSDSLAEVVACLFPFPRAQHAYTAGILAAVQFRELEDLQTEHSTFIEEGAWARCCSLAFARIQGPASAQRACLCAGVTHVWTFLVSALTRLPNATQLCPRSRTRRG